MSNTPPRPPKTPSGAPNAIVNPASSQGSATATPINNTSPVSSSASKSPSNATAPSTSSAAQGIADLNIGSLIPGDSRSLTHIAPTLPASHTPSQAPTLVNQLSCAPRPVTDAPPAKRVRVAALIPPPDFDPREYEQIINLVSNAPTSAILDIAYQDKPLRPKIVVRNIPRNVNSDDFVLHMKGEGLAYHEVRTFASSGRAVITFSGTRDFEDAKEYPWPWGTVDKDALEAPYADYESFFRIVLVVKENNMTNMLVELAGGFASLRIRVISAELSPNIPGQINVYLDSLNDYLRMHEYEGDIVIGGVLGKKDTHMLHKPNLSSTDSPLVYRLFVGNVDPNKSDATISRDIKDAICSSNSYARVDEFFGYATHCSSNPKCQNKRSSYGFAQCAGRTTLQFLISDVAKGILKPMFISLAKEK